MECEEYPDIYRPIPPGTPSDEAKKIETQNEVNERLYLAVRYVLRRDFDLKDAIPAEPKSFPGKLSDEDKAQFVGILGLIHADNWEDPSNGKRAPGPDDVLVRGDGKNETFVIDRRFIDSVVDAVKEYTASSELFNNVYKLMREEAGTGPDAKPRQPGRVGGQDHA
jgi:hypothetical protein